MLEDAIILLAEDDDGHCLLIRRYLQSAGIRNEVLCFGDGQRVVDFLCMKGQGTKRKRCMRYVLLLDIRMPVMDGLEVLQKVRSEELLTDLPVIMVTTTDEGETIRKCHELGCTKYIVKPTNFKFFIEVIDEMANLLRNIEIPILN